MSKSIDAREIATLYKEWDSLIWLIGKATIENGMGGLDPLSELSMSGGMGLSRDFKAKVTRQVNERALGLFYERREEIENIFEDNGIPIPPVRK